jgi:hypothetical protein
MSDNYETISELPGVDASVSESFTPAALKEAINLQPAVWDSSTTTLPNLQTLRIATQVRELTVQGITLRNTFKEMEEVWLSLYDADKRCLIVEHGATKIKYQLVNLYAMKLVRYLNSIVGLDLVPMAQQDPATRTWKMDAIVLNIAGNKVISHEHLFRLFLVNLYGVSEDLVELALVPTTVKLRAYIQNTYGVDLGDTEHAIPVVGIEQAEAALYTYVLTPTLGYHVY